MKVTTAWLNDHLDPPASTDQIVAALAQAGFGCESREDLPDGDTLLDFEITSNRGDCVSVVGLAREVAAVMGRRLKSSEAWASSPCEANTHRVSHSHGLEAHAPVRVENQAHDLCPYYSARILRGVRIGPSPEWLRERIERVGQRSVNNIVDITNFVLIELGQPLHAFDLTKLDGPAIIVRRATPGETMVAIDGTRLSLNDRMLVIADARRPVALAGVMGGLDTEVGETTTDILLEAAVFHPANVRATSRRLKLASASSYRFERGIHPATVAAAAERAAQLIIEVAGGAMDGEPIVAAAPIPEPVSVTMRPQRCRTIAGIDIPHERMVEILTRLEITPDPGPPPQSGRRGEEAPIAVVIPPHRLDLMREIDLIEEVVRIHGLDHIQPRERIEIEVAPIQREVVRRRLIDEALVGCGFHEAITFSFLRRDDAEALLPPEQSLLLVQDDRRQHEPALQPSVLPGLLRCRKRNQDLGHKEMRLFQTAACFALKGDEKVEPTRLGLILDGSDRQQGLRRMRGAIEAAVSAVLGRGAIVTTEPSDSPWCESGSSGTVLLADQPIGILGVLHPRLQSHFDLETPVIVAELDHDTLMQLDIAPEPIGDLSLYPSIQRDLSIVVEEATRWAAIERAVRAAASPMLESIDFVGVYRGKPIERGRKSVTLRLTFRDPARTLRHEEVDPAVTTIVERLAAEAGAKLRESPGFPRFEGAVHRDGTQFP